VQGSISLTASETFLKRKQNRDFKQNLEAQREIIGLYKRHGVKVDRASIMAAFGCNFEGDVPIPRVLGLIDDVLALAAENELAVTTLSLADTMAWATPLSIKRMIGAVRERHSGLRLGLHLHDTRGMGIANALAGLEMGVDLFDAAVAGLGGCPFAAHKGAAGNVCTEDLVFMLHEMGIETGVDLPRLIGAAELAEEIVGHALPGSIKVGGPLDQLRSPYAAP
jgi:hydroxymethylglutaryl-CoA lyase